MTKCANCRSTVFPGKFKHPIRRRSLFLHGIKNSNLSRITESPVYERFCIICFHKKQDNRYID